MEASSPSSFSASYDTTTKAITAIIFVVFLVVILTTRSPFVACLLALLVTVTYAYSPRRYAVSEASIVVKRLIGDVRIPLKAVREARVASPDDFRGSIRLWASGGMFGYYGLFRTTKLGKCIWYVTSRDNAVVVIAGGKTTLLSPDDVDGFLAAIRATAPVPDAPWSEPHGAIQPVAARLSAGMLIGVTIAVAAVALVAFVTAYAPGPPGLTLTPGVLTIQDRFYPVTLKATDVDVEHIRVVDLTIDADWRPTARTNGFANSHYRSGWFRVANGQSVRMYRADGKHLVLLPPKGRGNAVLLEVSQPEQFVEEVRRRWSFHR